MTVLSSLVEHRKAVFVLLLVAALICPMVFIVERSRSMQYYVVLPLQSLRHELPSEIPLIQFSKWPSSSLHKRLPSAESLTALSPKEVILSASSLTGQTESTVSTKNANDDSANLHGQVNPVHSLRDSSVGLEDKAVSSSDVLVSQPPARPLMAVDPKVWKFEPPTSVLSTRPRGTMHPDSLNPKRTSNTEPPNLPQCHSKGDKVVSIYLESQNRLVLFFGSRHFSSGFAKCSLPDGAQCKLVGDDKLADAVFRFVYFIVPRHPLRYCDNQTLIVFNSERLRNTGDVFRQLDLADIRIDHFLTSDTYFLSVCNFDRMFEVRHRFDPKQRTKGVAMFLSNCKHKWRYEYVKQLKMYIDIDFYGECFHNVPQVTSRYTKGRNSIVIASLRRYRMMLTMENTIQENYITEKIWLAYSGGAIPVYLGPPDIYDWVPGNHTFIDPRDFASPKELAEYMKRVVEDDNLFKYHTSNFDWDRTKRMMDKYCPKADFVCRMCELAYKRKVVLNH